MYLYTDVRVCLSLSAYLYLWWSMSNSCARIFATARWDTKWSRGIGDTARRAVPCPIYCVAPMRFAQMHSGAILLRVWEEDVVLLEEEDNLSNLGTWGGGGGGGGDWPTDHHWTTQDPQHSMLCFILNAMLDIFSPTTTCFKAEPDMNGIVLIGMNDDDRNEWPSCIFLLLSQHSGN